MTDLKTTLSLMDSTLIAKFGAPKAEEIRSRILNEFEEISPRIPYISGPGTKMFNLFLLITAQEVAGFRVLRQFDQTPEEIWILCHQALRLRCAELPGWKIWFLRKIMFSRLIHFVMERRARLGQRKRFGDFEIEYLSSEGEDFDIGINYCQCANYRFAAENDAEEFAPYICMSDVALSDAFGWGLKRTQTLADGCEYCDFRMCQDAPTQLSSRTPSVQKTIERIHALELQE